MVLRNLVVISGVVFALLAIAPVHADDHDGDWVTISGTVWFDENVDGIRQPSESVAAGVRVDKRIGPYPANASWTDEQGQFTFTVWPWGRYNRPWAGVWLSVHYRRPGDEPVWKTDWGRRYTHVGCAKVHVEPGDPEHTVDIRIVQHRNDDIYGGSPPPQDWPLTNGHFFKQGLLWRDRCDAGYSVTNADDITFWNTWQKLGLENVGYPISGRYIWRGLVTQSFQKVIFQWRPGRGVYFVKVFDELHAAGYDDELRRRWSIPRRLGSLEPALPVHIQGELREKLREEIHRRRLALLDANPAIKERYYAAPDPLLQYGLPTSQVEDHGHVIVIRTQGAVFQQWKDDVPWAKASEVTIANGVDIAKAVSEVKKYDEVWRLYYYVYLFPPLGLDPLACIPGCRRTK